MKFRSTRFRRLMVLVTMVFSVGLEGRGAEESVKSPAVAAALPQVDVELRGVFEGVLPGTEEKNHLSLLVHPHFGDFHRKSYLRIPVGLRYGLWDNWDVSMELEGYFSHGLKDVSAFDQMGLSAFHVTTKYRPEWSPFDDWAMAARIRYSHPLDHPPVELTDGLEHIMPEITFAREIEGWPGAELFWGTGLDLVSTTPIKGLRDDNEFADDANSFSGGLVWQRGERVYTLETTYSTTALIGSTSQDRIQVRPGVIFRIPQKFTFNSRGDWRVGVALKWVYGPDGHDFGLSVKVRGNFDLKKLLGKR